MTRMTIGTAFSESFAFLKSNWTQMLLWLGGALFLVGLIGYASLGSTIRAMALAPDDPSILASAIGQFVFFGLIAAVIFYAASMLVWRGGLHPGEAPQFGWALQAGPAFAFGMMVVTVASYIVLTILLLVLMLVFGAALGGMSSLSPEALATGAVGGGALLVFVIVYIAVLVFMLWVQGRFAVAGPVMADRMTRNPLTGLGESWRLTGASQWTIVGFYLLFTIGIFVYALIAGVVVGGVFAAIAGGSPATATLSTLVVSALVYLPIILFAFSMPVGIYRAIAARSAGDVFA